MWEIVLPEDLQQGTGDGISGACKLHAGLPGLILSLCQVEFLSMFPGWENLWDGAG